VSFIVAPLAVVALLYLCAIVLAPSSVCPGSVSVPG